MSGPSELAFFGKITAGFTHELKNVLAIIKESSGLMEDLLEMSKASDFPHRERFLRAISSIQDQVRRGVELSMRLNRFAHSTDEPMATIDLFDTAEQVTLLAQRFARLKGVSLKAVGAAPLPVTIPPMQVQMALFIAAECCWNELPAGGEVRLCVSRREDGASLCVSCESSPGDLPDFSHRLTLSERWTRLQQLVSTLGGSIEQDAGHSCFALVFPSVPGASVAF